MKETIIWHTRHRPIIHLGLGTPKHQCRNLPPLPTHNKDPWRPLTTSGTTSPLRVTWVHHLQVIPHPATLHNLLHMDLMNHHPATLHPFLRHITPEEMIGKPQLRREGCQITAEAYRGRQMEMTRGTIEIEETLQGIAGAVHDRALVHRAEGENQIKTSHIQTKRNKTKSKKLSAKTLSVQKGDPVPAPEAPTKSLQAVPPRKTRNGQRGESSQRTQPW